jgi:(4-(4-[2-(gamma-L-glutamylamino)ethyl]phenoxymethyl)furan-2-yl)methanamine synthase
VTRQVIGWDVGGVNTKVALVQSGVVREVRSVPFEIQRTPGELAPLIARLAREIGAQPGDPQALTMTAELSQFFRTKRDGVEFVLDAVEQAVPNSPIHVYDTGGAFRSPASARADTLRVAASNWRATAAIVALTWPDSILVDIGTTTTDIIPVRGGEIVAEGRTDPERLLTGELVYLGTVRTPVEAIVERVPLAGGMAAVSAESFALVGDVHLWRGDIGPAEYEAPTPDGRPTTREAAGERLARIVCADREMLDDKAIDRIADHVAIAQVVRIARALDRVRSHQPSTSIVVTAGIGAFLAARAAARLGLTRVDLARHLGPFAARSAPAAAVALLLDRWLPA